jgi:hypothetical protein
MTNKRLVNEPRSILDRKPRLLLARRLASIKFVRGVIGTARRY